MNSKKLAAGLITVVMMALTPTANAQMDAGDPPAVRGPLSTTSSLQGCRTKTERHNGEVVAHFKVCFGYYLFDPDRETSATTDYGAFWAQVTVKPQGRWCARSARLDLHLPASGAHSKAPPYGTHLSPSRKRSFTTRLVVDAQGHSSATGIISNRFVVLPGKYDVARRREGRVHRSTWSGNEDRKIAFASGAELSWTPGDALPKVNPVVGGRLRRTNDC